MAPKLDRADLERMVDALERIHRGERAGGAEEGLRALAAAAAGPDKLYEEARRTFSAHEKLLRAQSEAAQRLVEGVRKRSTTPRQALLRLQAPPGGVAGGRFVVHNEGDRSATFRFVPRFHTPVHFGPAELVLAPGGRATVDVRLTLDGAFGAGDTATLLVDVVADDVPRLKLWLDVAVGEAQ